MRGFQQDAGELGAVGQHVVRPFQLEAVAAAPACRHRRRWRCGRPARRASSASAQRQPGDEAERRGELQLAGRRRAAASRRDCLPASPRRGRGGRARSPAASRRSRACRDRPRAHAPAPARWSSRPCRALRAGSLPRLPSARVKSHRLRRRSWRRLRRSSPIGPPIAARRTARRRRRGRAPARSSPDIGWKPPTGSSNHMILMMRR